MSEKNYSDKVSADQLRRELTRVKKKRFFSGRSKDSAENMPKEIPRIEIEAYKKYAGSTGRETYNDRTAETYSKYVSGAPAVGIGNERPSEKTANEEGFIYPEPGKNAADMAYTAGNATNAANAADNAAEAGAAAGVSAVDETRTAKKAPEVSAAIQNGQSEQDVQNERNVRDEQSGQDRQIVQDSQAAQTKKSRKPKKPGQSEQRTEQTRPKMLSEMSEEEKSRLTPSELEKLEKLEKEEAFEILVKKTGDKRHGSRKNVSANDIEAEISRVKHKREYSRVLRETVIILLGVAAVAVLISMLFLPVLRVTGSSMEPTLYGDELVVCAKYSEFKRGDIVAFYFNNKVLLKRVIGTPGDIINIDEDGKVTVNGELLTESYAENVALGETDLEFPVQVPESRLFVLGDNRETSIDSRSSEIGYIADEYVIGKVFLRVWPLGKLRTF